ncbi:GIY-YIG nuclease family protein [Prolixibacter denitrificans]|nr:GIY-YIG nuclease family protein [Prolixibacter denitrificans]
MNKGYMYILECSDGSYYTGSTKDLEQRLAQHQSGEGANHTRRHLPVRLVYYEEYARIDDAFYREKQVQGWSRKKKEALINGNLDMLPKLAKAYRDKGGFEKMKGGFENLSHQEENLSHQEENLSHCFDKLSHQGENSSLPEALEGNNKKTKHQ